VHKNTWFTATCKVASIGVVAFSLSIFARSAAPPANGATPAGWHAQGSGNWTKDHGEIVGTSPSSGSEGWLLLDHKYEDVMVRFSFQCHNCEAGLLFRGVTAGNDLSGTYISLAGASAGTVSKITVDAQGHESQQKSLGIPSGQNNRPVQLTLNPHQVLSGRR